MSEDTILVARNSFTTEFEGAHRSVARGETFRVGHPLVDGREELFDAFEVDNEWAEPETGAKSRKAAE